MTITQTALLELTDQWKEKSKQFSVEAIAFRKKEHTDAIDLPTSPREHSENLHGYAAGYAAARKELLQLLKVCEVCVGSGATLPSNGTTTMRVQCWKCQGTGMAITPTYAGPINCRKCGKQHWIGSDCPTNAGVLAHADEKTL